MLVVEDEPLRGSGDARAASEAHCERSEGRDMSEGVVEVAD